MEQWSARQAHNLKVVSNGSNPTPATKYINYFDFAYGITVNALISENRSSKANLRWASCVNYTCNKQEKDVHSLIKTSDSRLIDKIVSVAKRSKASGC